MCYQLIHSDKAFNGLKQRPHGYTSSYQVSTISGPGRPRSAFGQEITQECVEKSSAGSCRGQFVHGLALIIKETYG